MYYCYKRPIISGYMGIKTWGHRLKSRKRGGKIEGYFPSFIIV